MEQRTGRVHMRGAGAVWSLRRGTSLREHQQVMCAMVTHSECVAISIQKDALKIKFSLKVAKYAGKIQIYLTMIFYIDSFFLRNS